MSIAPTQRATLTDIAKLTGVSRQVAGSVLNGKQGNNCRASEATVQRILAVAEKLNYRPNLAAMRLRGRRAHLYGLLVASAGDPLRAMLVQQLDIEAANHGCQTLIGNTVLRADTPYPNRFADRVEEFLQRDVDGILCMVHNWFPYDRQAILAAHPHTVFYDDPGIPGAVCVIPDRAAAMAKAVRYLLGKGRRRIALATLSRTVPSHLDRVAGYRKELADQGVEFDPRLHFVAEAHGLRFNDSGSQTSLDMPGELTDLALDQLVRDAGADAVICQDDFLAANMLRRLRARGIEAGKTVAVVGYLNHALAGFTDPTLTTLDPQYAISARHMVSMLEQMIKGHPPEPQERMVKIEPALIERESA